jgi:acyl transferase domain-containing protein
LWDLCVAGKDAWSPIPTDRWDGRSFYDKKKGKSGRVRSVYEPLYPSILS